MTGAHSCLLAASASASRAGASEGLMGSSRFVLLNPGEGQSMTMFAGAA